MFEKHCENDKNKHYNDDDDSTGDHDDNTADDFSGGDLTLKSRKFGEHQAKSMTMTRIVMILHNGDDTYNNGDLTLQE